jgi:hypothetical protein
LFLLLMLVELLEKWFLGLLLEGLVPEHFDLRSKLFLELILQDLPKPH